MGATVICLANQKGGVGKTTTTINLGTALADLGQRVLLVDADPQANTTIGLGIDPAQTDGSMYHVLVKGAPLDDVIVDTDVERLRLAPSHIDLAAAEGELYTIAGRDFVLKERLDPLRERYDYVLIDCPPSLGMFTVSALAAADAVIVPLPAQFYAMAGFAALLDTIGLVQKRMNRDLRVMGILISQFDRRTNYDRDFADQVARRLDGRYRIFDTKIAHAVRVKEAAHEQQPVLRYDPRSQAAQAYQQLAEEVLRESRAQPVGRPVRRGPATPAAPPAAPAAPRVEAGRG
jgi:chromosome partitioning protein